MKFLLPLLVLVGVLIVPIKLTAQSVGARHTGILSCLTAVIASVMGAMVAKTFLPFGQIHGAFNILIGFAVGSLVYMTVLGTTWFKGVIIASVQLYLSLLLVFFVAALGGSHTNMPF